MSRSFNAHLEKANRNGSWIQIGDALPVIKSPSIAPTDAV